MQSQWECIRMYWNAFQSSPLPTNRYFSCLNRQCHRLCPESMEMHWDAFQSSPLSNNRPFTCLNRHGIATTCTWLNQVSQLQIRLRDACTSTSNSFNPPFKLLHRSVQVFRYTPTNDVHCLGSTHLKSRLIQQTNSPTNLLSKAESQ